MGKWCCLTCSSLRLQMLGQCSAHSGHSPLTKGWLLGRFFRVQPVFVWTTVGPPTQCCAMAFRRQLHKLRHTAAMLCWKGSSTQPGCTGVNLSSLWRLVRAVRAALREGTLSLCHTMENSIGQWLVCVCNSKLVSCVYNSRKLKLCNSYERTFQARNYEWSVITRV